MDPCILLSVITAILGTIIAVYFDFRESIVPNKLILSMFVFSIPIAFLRENLLLWGINILLAFLIFYTFWRIRIWCGGDSKLLIALAALIPTCPSLGVLPEPAYSNFFFLSIIMNLLIVHIICILPLTLMGKIKIYQGVRMSPLILVSLIISVFVGDLIGVLI